MKELMGNSLIDILLFIVIAGTFVALVWEIIPDEKKKFWKYADEIRKDRRRGGR